MQCPVDGTNLLMAERQGIEIDYCPKCRGVWLDRGELDKLIERGTKREASSTQDSASHYDRDPIYKSKNDDAYKRKNDDDYYPDDRRTQSKRRGSFLEDIFDIFD